MTQGPLTHAQRLAHQELDTAWWALARAREALSTGDMDAVLEHTAAVEDACRGVQAVLTPPPATEPPLTERDEWELRIESNGGRL